MSFCGYQNVNIELLIHSMRLSAPTTPGYALLNQIAPGIWFPV